MSLPEESASGAAEVTVAPCGDCGTRPGNRSWVEVNDAVSFYAARFTPQRRCDYCATLAQLEYAKSLASQVPSLQAKLDMLAKELETA